MAAGAKTDSALRLETEGDYPHNGLAGFAFDALGWMFFGFGENMGVDYKIIGSDANDARRLSPALLTTGDHRW